LKIRMDVQNFQNVIGLNADANAAFIYSITEERFLIVFNSNNCNQSPNNNSIVTSNVFYHELYHGLIAHHLLGMGWDKSENHKAILINQWITDLGLQGIVNNEHQLMLELFLDRWTDMHYSENDNLIPRGHFKALILQGFSDEGAFISQRFGYTSADIGTTFNQLMEMINHENQIYTAPRLRCQ
jgi:hypothetical protein